MREGIDFLISYVGADSAWAVWIASQLEAKDYTTLMHAVRFEPDSSILAAAPQAAFSAQRRLAILSPAYLNSLAKMGASVFEGWSAARETLLPIRVVDCQLPGFLAEVRCIDLLGNDEALARKTLLDGVEQRLGGVPRPQGAQTTTKRHTGAPFPGAPQVAEVWHSERAVADEQKPPTEKLDRKAAYRKESPQKAPRAGRTTRGEIAGRYELSGQIAEGSTSVVYRARHRTLNKSVAIKLIRPELAAHAGIRELFFREAQAANRAAHANVIDIHDVGETQHGEMYLVMEHLAADTLGGALSRGALPLLRSIDILKQVSAALGNAHSIGIAHGNLKSTDIMLTKQQGRTDFVKLVDFGHAYIAYDFRLEPKGPPLGAVEYTSPEQAEGGGPGIASDLYSIGVVFFEMLTGRVPFQSSDRAQLLDMHRCQEPPRPSAMRADCPPDAERIILRLLSKAPRQRFRDGNHLFQELEGLERALRSAADYTPSLAGSARQVYRPYPMQEVDELEQLTRARGARGVKVSVSAVEQATRQARIDELVARLKRSPVQGDVVAGALLVRIVGKGNYGVVWQATSLDSGNPRAVKIFDSDRLGLGTSLYHFRRGVRAMEHLNQIPERPETVAALYQTEASKLAFSMAFLEGGDLTNIAEFGWSLEVKLRHFRTICLAVQFAHENGVIHRDIKPANIVMHKGQPVLTDFDIADLLFAQTKSAHAAGTVAFAAPEELADQRTTSRTGDIYSLGRLLHFLLLEANPPLRFEDVPRLDEISKDYPRLTRVVRRCTFRAPESRYQTVLELLHDLTNDGDAAGAYAAVESNRQFHVALSFPGARREYAKSVADHLAASLGKERVLYDKYHEAAFARVDLDVYLPRLYREQAELIVVFLCPEYRTTPWCQLEWRHIRQLVTALDAPRIMLVSFGPPGDLSEIGILGGDGYIEVSQRAAAEVASLILARLHANLGATSRGPNPTSR